MLLVHRDGLLVALVKGVTDREIAGLGKLKRKYRYVCGELDGSRSRSEALPHDTQYRVVKDGQASSSFSCLDLASQAPSANLSVFTFRYTYLL